MFYKNKDAGAQRDGIEMASKVTTYFEIEFKRLIDNKYYGKSWTVLSMELRRAALDELSRIFNVKLVEMKRIEQSSSWKYKPQDELYPKSKREGIN
jgi:hypothetical protein